MFEIIKPGTQIDFVTKRHIWMTVSAAAIAVTVFLYFTRGLNYGIDFTGGAEVHIRVPATWDIGKVRETMESNDVKDARIVTVGEPSESRYIIRTQLADEAALNQVSAKIETALKQTLQPNEFAVEKVDVVGPAAGKSLRISGFLSMFYALLCVVIYVAIRFDISYTPGVILSVIHDTTIVMGAFLITQKQFDLTILAAILALIGYSNNDTIVTYDRVREIAHNNPGMSVETAVNRAINETLSRTFLTAFSTFLSVLALWIFGGPVIQDFAFTLMVGLIIGSYSSMFIAGSAVIVFTNWQKAQAAKAAGRQGKKKQFRPRVEPAVDPKFQA